jgi:hypothetical protein
MSGAIPSLPNTPSLRGAQLKENHRDNFTCNTQLFIARGNYSVNFSVLACALYSGKWGRLIVHYL